MAYLLLLVWQIILQKGKFKQSIVSKILSQNFESELTLWINWLSKKGNVNSLLHTLWVGFYLFISLLHFIVSFLPKIGEKSGFSKGFCLGGGVTFQSAWGERVLGRNFNFQISAWGGSLIFDNLQRFENFKITYPFSS